MSEAKQPENPQAFPSGDAPYHHGMTLRDYFAGQFMAARLANPTTNPDLSDYDMSVTAYQRADAMLRARDAT